MQGGDSRAAGGVGGCVARGVVLLLVGGGGGCRVWPVDRVRGYGLRGGGASRGTGEGPIFEATPSWLGGRYLSCLGF